ncbi:leucine-rich repeat-containing protein 4B-like [Zophobas morio]|uniref:leucine-rich repeat-containing protein 4B-like n=1 Tax=Zophobas morio TaxID=2755281 RepID=UPI00308300D0
MKHIWQSSAVQLIVVITLNQIQCQHFNYIDIKIYKSNRTILVSFADEINHETEATEISIEGQNLTTLKEGTFNDLLQLKILKIQDCGLEDIQDGTFNNLPNLQVLNLNHNVLRTIHRDTFKDLSITRLYLACNAIESFEKDAFHDIKYLEVLDLSQNRLKNLHSHMFKGTTFLRQVNFSFNKLERIPHECFLHGFVNIITGQDSYIDLSDNLLTYLNEKSLEGIYNIKNLYLQNNVLEQINSNVFDAISYIEDVNFENNNLTTLSNSILNHLKSTKYVRLSGNPWNCNFVKKFDQWCKNNNKTNTLEYYVIDECNSS